MQSSLTYVLVASMLLAIAAIKLQQVEAGSDSEICANYGEDYDECWDCCENHGHKMDLKNAAEGQCVCFVLDKEAIIEGMNL